MKLLVVLVLVLTFPAVVGGAAVVAAAAPHAAPAPALFPWVPAGGFPDGFPFGQCTWWAAYNRRVSWRGNAADWLANEIGAVRGVHKLFATGGDLQIAIRRAREVIRS